MTPSIYTLTSASNLSLILHEAWFRAHTMGLNKLFDWVNPYSVPSIYVVNEGLIEVWDNARAYQWIRDQLQADFVRRPQMLAAVVSRYEERLKMLQAVCKGECPRTIKALLEYLEVLLDTMIDFLILYHLAHDTRTSEGDRNQLIRIANKDKFFHTQDSCIRKGLQCIYPHLRSLEGMIRYREIKYNQAPDQKELEARKQGWIVVPGEIYELGTLETFAQKHPPFVFDKKMV